MGIYPKGKYLASATYAREAADLARPRSGARACATGSASAPERARTRAYVATRSREGAPQLGRKMLPKFKIKKFRRKSMRQGASVTIMMVVGDAGNIDLHNFEGTWHVSCKDADEAMTVLQTILAEGLRQARGR